MNNIEFITEKKIIAIIRGIYGSDLMKLASALHDGGIRIMEVTFDQSDTNCIEKTTAAVASLCSRFTDCLIGAGTVLTEQQVIKAHEAGAQLIVSPDTCEQVIRTTKELGMISIPGAMTPTEIVSAHRAGADFVKVFPAGILGPKYIKDVLAPLKGIRLVATAGINEENVSQFLQSGAVAVGISGRLTEKKMVEEGSFDMLKERAASFCSIISNLKA